VFSYQDSTANSDATALRSMSAVLIRKELPSLLSSSQGTPINVEAVKASLLSAIQSETSINVGRKLASILGDSCILLCGPNFSSWQGFLAHLDKSFALIPSLGPSSNPTLSTQIEISVHCLFRIAEVNCQEVLLTSLSKLIPILTSFLTAPNAQSFASLKAIIVKFLLTCVNKVSNDSFVNASVQFIPTIMATLNECLQEEDLSNDILQSLLDVVNEKPIYFRSHLSAIFPFMLSICNKKELDDRIRVLGLEFIVEYSEKSPGTVRKLPTNMLTSILSTSLLFLSNMEDEKTKNEEDHELKKWLLEEEDLSNYIGDGDDQDNELVQTGASSLDRLARAIGGKTIWPCFSSIFTNALNASNWRARKAALIGLSLIGEGSFKVLLPNIRQIVTGILPFLNDPHPRVKHAAIRCIGQLILDFSNPDEIDNANEGGETVIGNRSNTSGKQSSSNPSLLGSNSASGVSKKKVNKMNKSIQEAAGDLLLPALTNAISDKNRDIPRLRGLASGAVVNFCSESCPPSLLLSDKYTPSLLEALFSVLRDVDSLRSKEMALTAIGCIASVIELDFIKFYPIFVPLVKSILFNSNTHTNEQGWKDLKNKALESFSFIAYAVGKEVSGVDIAEVLNGLVRMQMATSSSSTGASSPSSSNQDSETFRYAAAACARLGDTLGLDFAPYVPYVLPPLIQAAKRSIGVAVMDADDPNSKLAANEAGVTTTTVELQGGRQHTIALESNALEEKISAIETLGTYLATLGPHVPPMWALLDACADAILGAFDTTFAAVRTEAAAASSSLFLAALSDQQNKMHGQIIFDRILPVLLPALVKEHDDETRYLLAEAIEEIMREAHETHLAEKVSSSISSSAAPPSSITVSNDLAVCLCTNILAAMKTTIMNRQESVKAMMENPDADEEDVAQFEESQEAEEDLFTNLIDSIGYLIKVRKQSCLQILQETNLLPTLIGFLNTKEPLFDSFRAGAVCICDDLLEFASPESNVILPMVLPTILSAISTSNKPSNSATSSTESSDFLKQASVYGVGVMFQHVQVSPSPSPSCLSMQDVHTLLTKLSAIVTSKFARDEDVETITDNAVSSMLKCLLYKGTCLKEEECEFIINTVCKYLPIKSDALEARFVHSTIIDAIEKSDLKWLGGQSLTRLPMILQGLGEALAIHDTRIAKNDAKKQNSEEVDEEDEEEEEEEEPLFNSRDLDRIKVLFASLKTSPAGPVVAQAMKNMKKKPKTALSKYGL
jgi:importin-5